MSSTTNLQSTSHRNGEFSPQDLYTPFLVCMPYFHQTLNSLLTLERRRWGIHKFQEHVIATVGQLGSSLRLDQGTLVN
jgi:hypothetical protein